jgi:hypothetical protein
LGTIRDVKAIFIASDSVPNLTKHVHDDRHRFGGYFYRFFA